MAEVSRWSRVWKAIKIQYGGLVEEDKERKRTLQTAREGQETVHVCDAGATAPGSVFDPIVCPMFGVLAAARSACNRRSA